MDRKRRKRHKGGFFMTETTLLSNCLITPHIKGKCDRCRETGIEFGSLHAFNYEKNFLCENCFKLWIRFLKGRKRFYAMEKHTVEGRTKFGVYWDKLFSRFCLEGKAKVLFS